MKMLKVKMSALDSEEFFEFLKQLKMVVDRYDINKLKVKNEYDDLVKTFPSLDAALKKEKSNELSKLLAKIDTKRDRLITAFVKWLHIMLDFPDDEVVANATNFIHLVEGLSKDIARETYFAETTIINTVVELFTLTVDNKTKLAAMNGTAWITALDAVNAEFGAKYSERVADNTSNDSVPSFGVARKVSAAVYYEFVSLLTSRYNTAKADKQDVTLFESCIAELNTLIQSANVLGATSITHRTTKTEDKSGDGK